MQDLVTPIGIIHSPFQSPEGVPIQTAFSEAVGTLEIYAATSTDCAILQASTT